MGIGAAGAAPALVAPGNGSRVHVGTCAGENVAPWEGFGLVV